MIVAPMQRQKKSQYQITFTGSRFFNLVFNLLPCRIGPQRKKTTNATKIGGIGDKTCGTAISATRH
jgi:hypothetical protein